MATPWFSAIAPPTKPALWPAHAPQKRQAAPTAYVAARPTPAATSALPVGRQKGSRVKQAGRQKEAEGHAGKRPRSFEKGRRRAHRPEALLLNSAVTARTCPASPTSSSASPAEA